MPIAANDVRLFESVRMTDYPDGGGRMTTNAIVDGVDNNLFPDIGDLDRVSGRLALRKVHAAAINNDNTPYLSSHTALVAPPSDPSCDAFLFQAGGYTTERAAAAEALVAWHRVASGNVHRMKTNGANVVTVALAGPTIPSYIAANATLALYADTAGTPIAPRLAQARVLSLSARFSGTPWGGSTAVDFVELTVDRAVPLLADGRAVIGAALLDTPDPKVYAALPVSGALSSAATVVPLASTSVQVVPYSGSGPYPTADNGIDPAPLAYVNGRLPAVRGGDAVLVHHTATTAPATVSNSQVVSLGRTDLAMARVIGNDNVEIARFVRNAVAPTGVGCSANLSAGTVTFTSVAGMSQPVRIEHRIEEMKAVDSISGSDVTLTSGLGRAYPSGSLLSSLMQLGDLLGRAQAGFAQTAWTSVFSDSVIGSSPSADYNEDAYPVLCTNKGAITERWAIEFTSATAFRLWGERLGLVGTGNTAADLAIVNPATGVPYFTLRALGWGLGWSAGNAYRFNTIGANAQVWAGRSVEPGSSAYGDDSATLELRGYVNV